MSDICHVAVDHIWQLVDSGVSLSAGFGEGLVQGVAAFYNTEVSSMPGDGEFALSAYTQPSDGLRDVARAETSQAVYEVLALLKDVGEVSLEAGYGAADSIKNMPHLVSDMVDVTRALGTTLATLGADSLVLLDAAEHGNLQDFTQQLDKMNADCRQIKEGLDAFTTQLGEHIKAHMPQDGQITKAHAKMAVRTGARMVTDAVVMNLGMKGVSAICKGVSGHVGQMSKELGRIKEIKDVSVAEVRKALLVAQLERSPLAAQAPTLYKGTMWAHVVKDQVKMLQPMVNRASSMKTIEDMVQSSIKRSVETQPSRFESTIQKAQRWLSMQPKPGYILLPVSKGRELASLMNGNKIDVSKLDLDQLPLHLYDSSIGDLSKLQDLVNQFKDVPGALDKDGPLRRVLSLGYEGAKEGQLKIAPGAFYELEVAQKLESMGEKVLVFNEKHLYKTANREFDIIAANKFIECKSIDWTTKVGKPAENLRRQIREQASIANGLNKEFVLFSNQPIPIDWQIWFNKKNITVVIGT